MIDLKALQKQVALLEADLKPRGLEDPRLKVEWRAAKSAERTAATFETWLGERVTQVAVAWVLASVFVRFCEDNGLIELPFITGPKTDDEDRDALARDLQDEFYKKHPESDDRGWLEAAFDALSVSPVAAALFDRRHNPMWTIKPTPHAVKTMLDFWRQKGPDGEILCDLTDPEWNTRFLGDLYQWLSKDAREKYALFQTPEFVEEFILKYTLDPAIEEFGLEPEPWGHLRVIDPACGSGHFLLGAFQRLLLSWETHSPAADRYDLVAAALRSVHGVDKNPFAVAIARFRLMLAATKASGVTRLTEQVDFPLNIAVGDSLLHGKGAPGRQGEFDFGNGPENHTYRTEDVEDYIKSVNILEVGSYHVVVANPPYITVKDKAENENYRKAYTSCTGKYALSVPFAERIFQLAIRGIGYTGQITSNSFMKREFGKKLIEEFFNKIDLTHVIDTSGAFIPGHGTPTVVLFGRCRWPRRNSTCRAVLGIKGEPIVPSEPANGLVWRSIISQVDIPGSEDEWVSVVELARDRLSSHPWSLSGGGSGDLLAWLNATAPRRMEDYLRASIGFAGFSANDDAFDVPEDWQVRMQVPYEVIRPLVAGKDIKSWAFEAGTHTIAPYGSDGNLIPVDNSVLWTRYLWMAKRSMQELANFSGRTRRNSGVPWWSWYHWIPSRNANDDRIIIAKIATHNEVSINRSRAITNQHVFVLQIAPAENVDQTSGIAGLLGSSLACFWLRQVSHDRGNRGEGGGITSAPWERFFELTAAKLNDFPLPAEILNAFPQELGHLAQVMADLQPASICCEGVPTKGRLNIARAEYERIRGRMIALQEELDWDVYRRYGLITEDEAAELVAKPESVPELKLGERAFEIVLARRVARGELETQWFARHRSAPITEIPAEWPEDYRRVVAKRIEMIERNRNIGLIERPECKRRWQSEPWESKERAALTTWLLDRCEERSLWFDGDSPRPMTVNRLADRLRADADVVSVARLLKGQDADLADVLREIIADEHVPFVAQYRYKPSGLDKRRQWERMWDLQREEDARDERLDIPVPPKYASADFQKNSYWRHRGKLDVPKERFISYPDASPDSDAKSLLIGWAGWDHREQADALIWLIGERSSADGWDTTRLMGLLAGLLEVMPWVRQWHGEIVPEFHQSWADAYDGFLITERESRSLTEDDLRNWHPPQSGRGRRR